MKGKLSSVTDEQDQSGLRLKDLISYPSTSKEKKNIDWGGKHLHLKICDRMFGNLLLVEIMALIKRSTFFKFHYGIIVC